MQAKNLQLTKETCNHYFGYNNSMGLITDIKPLIHFTDMISKHLGIPKVILKIHPEKSLFSIARRNNGWIKHAELAKGNLIVNMCEAFNASIGFTLVHEMIHIDQVLKGELVCDLYNYDRFWQGVLVPNRVFCASDYYNLPWEKDANFRARDILYELGLSFMVDENEDRFTMVVNHE